MSVTTLVIARHGNTFSEGETPRRVGACTDLPLVDSGRTQADALGKYLKNNNLIPDVAYTSRQARTIETARRALSTSDLKCITYPSDVFNEIDYGPDEDKTEDDVRARIGAEALMAWDDHAIVPPGWIADPAAITGMWMTFGRTLIRDYAGKTVLVVTSNGVARFAPALTGDLPGFARTHKIKMATGALSILRHRADRWTVEAWNVTP